jgi:uncharacterized membrane protein YbhN (UPF0104 family)
MRAVRRYGATAAKLVLAGSLVAWMASSGRLDFASVARSLLKWRELLTIALLFYVNVGLLAWRWRLLLGSQQVPITMRRSYSLTMIGLLFGAVIPGTVGGDVVKACYIASGSGERKAHVLSTILADRVMGLLSLLTVGSAGALWNLELVIKSRPLGTLSAMVAAMAAGGALLLASALIAAAPLRRWFERSSARVPLSGVLSKSMLILAGYRRKPSVLIAAFAVSLPCHVLACIAFYLALHASGIVHIPLHRVFLIVPLGLVAAAVPVSPAGIGVGQAAFYALFRLVLGEDGAAGANTCTVYQFVFVVVSLTGLFWFLAYRHPSGSAATEAESPGKPSAAAEDSPSPQCADAGTGSAAMASYGIKGDGI